MRQYTVLQSVVERNVPVLNTLPPEERKKVLRQLLDESIVHILLKIKLPDPIEFKTKMMKEHFLDQRRRKEAKRGNKKFNYNLWRNLYEAKTKLRYNLLENSSIVVEKSNDFSSTVIYEAGESSNFSGNVPTTTASSILKDINQIASNIQVSKDLQAKMVVSESHQEFVNCINDICRSYEVEKLAFAEYLMYEKKDLENPEWKKIILDTKFYERDFERKLELWEKLRDIVDKSIDELKYKTNNLEEIKELEKRFYIHLCQ